MKKSENLRDARGPSVGVKQAPDRKKPKRKKRPFRIDIYKGWCKACGICVAFCPAHVFAENEEAYPQVKHPEECIGCGWCEIHCPDFAITVREEKEREE